MIWTKKGPQAMELGFCRYRIPEENLETFQAHLESSQIGEGICHGGDNGSLERYIS